MKKKAFIWDLDGTLLDTLDDLTDAVNHALGICRLHMADREDVRRFLGKGTQYLLRNLMPPDIDEQIRDKAFLLFREYYEKHAADKTKPYPGILEILDEARKKHIRCVITSNKLESAVISLSERFFHDRIDFSLGDRPGQKRKPDPEMVEKAIIRLVVKKEDVLYIGDSEPDVLTAANAGIDGVFVTWGFRTREQLSDAGAGEIIDKPEELQRYF